MRGRPGAEGAGDCVSGEGIDRQKLTRGIPFVRSIEWDKRRSGRDCGGDRHAAGEGTYVALARAGGLKSNKNVFHLR